MVISSPGPVYVRGTMRAPASGDPIACARARRGSTPPSSNAPRPPSAPRPVIFRPCSSACAPAAAPGKPSAPSPPPSSPPSITCSRTAPATMIPGLNTSTAGQKPLRQSVSSSACKTSASPSKSLLSPHDQLFGFLLEPRDVGKRQRVVVHHHPTELGAAPQLGENLAGIEQMVGI